MMKRKGPRVATLLWLVTAAPSLYAQFEHPDLKAGKKTIHNVLILPAHVNVVKSGMKGNETLVEESRGVESALPQLIASALASKGCNVLPNTFSDETLNDNPDLKYALADLQGRFDKLEEQLGRKPKDVRTGRFTLGDDVANFSAGAQADALVFVRGQGVVSTSGKKVFGAVTGMGAATVVGFSIAIVDAQSGAVLYFAEPNAWGDFVSKPDRMKKAIEKSFNDFQNPKSKK
jgi:hypothetical protein